MLGRISVGAINHAFLSAGGNVNEYGAAMHRAVADGWLEMHASGAYVKLTQKGADILAKPLGGLPVVDYLAADLSVKPPHGK
jgi:hypothetical protein